jgi:hypothetical protein
MAKILWIFFTMPILYLLSYGPVFRLALKRSVPEWVFAVYTPVEILCSQSPAANRLFVWYAHLWTGDAQTEVF